ncbi:hypothetical protein GF326_01765 [Candidatus Bathyarchaeota archaeon]|nr:hypothetical protein [Candidatus Bathyarchaeota archaeon]
MSNMDRYTRAGIIFLVFGCSFGVFSHWILQDVTFTSIGLASIILGATALLVPSRAVPGEGVRALVEAAAVNIEAILEEFDASRHGVYLPPRDERVYCFIPLGNEDFDGSSIMRAPIRVVTRFSGVDGLILFPPGGEVIRLAELGVEAGLEDSLVYILVDYLELVESVRSVVRGDRVVVEFNQPRLDTSFNRFQDCLGSLSSSVSGCVLASVLGKPVMYMGEERALDVVKASFRILDVD